MASRTWPAQLTWGDRGSSSASALMEAGAQALGYGGGEAPGQHCGHPLRLGGLGCASGFMVGVGRREAMRGLGKGKG